jgi:hypothetical protein
MNQWSYPIGAIVNNDTLTERRIFGALPVTINDISYGSDIFSKWPMADLAALGLNLFVENPIPQDYIGGVPVDIETDEQITRTYPDMYLDTGAVTTRQKQAIYAELSELDGERVRPAAAITRAQANSETPDPDDVAKLNQLEDRAEVLRQELRALDVANTPLP